MRYPKRPKTTVAVLLSLLLAGWWVWPTAPTVTPDQFVSVTLYRASAGSMAEAEIADLRDVADYEITDRSTLLSVFGCAEHQYGLSSLSKSGGYVCVAKLKNGQERRLALSHLDLFVIAGEPGWFKIPGGRPSAVTGLTRRFWPDGSSNPPASQAAGALHEASGMQ